MAGDFDGITGLGITAGSGVSVPHLKSSETGNDNFVTFGKCIADIAKSRIDCGKRGFFG